jgi:ABC-type Fe3+-hydroxamate transport system substrate-binding protein
MILGMGLADRLVAVSNYEPPRPETAGLPHVGDYRTIDWEQLTRLAPGVMIVQYGPDKMPQGLLERAAERGIELVNIQLYRLADVHRTLGQLGQALGEPGRATEASERLEAQFDAVRQRVSGRPPVRTLLSMSDPQFVAGGGTVLDDVLSIAGGTNVVGGEFNSYPTLDRERILMLNPDVVLNLMPGASEQELRENRRFWEAMPQVSAVAKGQVYQLTEPHLLLHGYNLGQVAEILAAKLHPVAKDTP